MKRLYLIPLLALLLILSSCSTKYEHQLEKTINGFDYYTELFTFEQDHADIKLLAAYNEEDTELTYIYFMNDIDSDYEILVYKTVETLNDELETVYEKEIIYEDFVVDDYEEDNQLIGSFRTSDFELEDDMTKVEIRLVVPGFISGDSYVGTRVVQEFYLIKSIEDKHVLESAFIEGSSYQDRDLEIDGIGAMDQLRTRVMWGVLVIGVVLYFISLYLYKKYYTTQIQFTLQTEKRIRFLPDLQSYKFYSFIALFIITIVLMVASQGMIQTSLDRSEFYGQYSLNYEEVNSDTMSIRYGSNTPTTMAEQEDKTNQIAFFDALGQHRILGYVQITTGKNYPVTTTIPGGSYGGYSYRLIYRQLLSDVYTIDVFDGFYGEYRNIVYSREFDFDGWDND